MPTAQQDTEITLGTGRMLTIFFALVLVCALFFSLGFSLGKKTSQAVGNSLLNLPSGTPAVIVRPSAVKNNSSQAQSGDFSFYKAVGEKTTDAALTPQGNKEQASSSDAAASTTQASPKANADAGSSNAGSSTATTPAASAAGSYSGTYYVQVAAVSRQEDADSLVEALKKKQYPALAANNASVDKFYHVQVGPYGDLKEAEAMRARLIGDGYNPIVKK
jgi:cell division septation protein DedD